MGTEPRTIRALLIGLALVGCAGPDKPQSTPNPTAATRPDVPAGWSTITSDEGDVEVTLPGDFEVLFTTGGILAQPPIAEHDAVTTLELWATGPASLEQPMAGESARAWLERLELVPRAGKGGVTATADGLEQEVMLPSGPALQVAVTAQPGTPDESRVVVYAIETQGGVAMLRIIGFPPDRLEERAAELALVARLLRIGAAAGD